MDIGELIKFKRKGGGDGLPPKVSIFRLYNRPVRILKWEVKPSRFTDGSGEFAEITAETLDNTGETIRFNTGSKVIVSQLVEIAKALDTRNCGDRTFTCRICSHGNFIKMFPLAGEAAQ